MRECLLLALSRHAFRAPEVVFVGKADIAAAVMQEGKVVNMVLAVVA
jgi:type III secretion system FlhB-like substrate exporter